MRSHPRNGEVGGHKGRCVDLISFVFGEDRGGCSTEEEEGKPELVTGDQLGDHCLVRERRWCLLSVGWWKERWKARERYRMLKLNL